MKDKKILRDIRGRLSLIGRYKQPGPMLGSAQKGRKMMLLFFAAEAANLTTCEKLANDYEYASKRMAFVMAEGVGDNSAVRANMREAQQNNIRQEARDMLDLMKMHECDLPTEIVSVKPYFMQAQTCGFDMRMAMLRKQPASAIDIPSCDMSKWERES